MAELELSNRARRDLVDIRLFSNRQFGKAVADTYFLGFEEAFDLLISYPQSGHAEPELGKDIRCLTHRQHRIFYRLESDSVGGRVRIIRILHHAMDTRTAMAKVG